MSKFTTDLYTAFRLCNAFQLSRHYECPVIYFHTRKGGVSDHRAVITFVHEDGRWREKTIRIRTLGCTLKESRDRHLAAAEEWAQDRGLGVSAGDWGPTGFPHTWMPCTARLMLDRHLTTWRKARRAAADADYQNGTSL